MSKILSQNDFNEIQTWVNQNARPLELALWKYHFENGSQEAVLNALRYYQNADGGFGNAIEPDNWNPNSTPYAADFVMGILRQIQFTDLSHPLYQGALRYLKDTPYQGENGWFFSVPTTDAHPHAVWWQFNEEVNNSGQNIGLTTSLCGFILRYVTPGEELYDIALKYTDMLFDKLKSADSSGDMGVGGYCGLKFDLQAAGLHNRFDLDFLDRATRGLVAEHFGEYKWSFHQDLASALPNAESRSYYYEDYHEAVEAGLDELIAIRPSKGVWGIPWQWYDSGAYAKEFAISENWWKAYKAIEKVLFLKENGRIL